MSEGFSLKFRVPSHKFFMRDGQLCPLVKDTSGFRTGSALKLGFDLPRQVRTIVLTKDGVCDGGVSVLRVDQEAVNVKDARSDWWEAGR